MVDIGIIVMVALVLNRSLSPASYEFQITQLFETHNWPATQEITEEVCKGSVRRST